MKFMLQKVWGCHDNLASTLQSYSSPGTDLNRINPRYYFSGGHSMKTAQIPMFLHLALEFGVIVNIDKHENIEVLGYNRNKSSKEMPGNPRFHINRKHIRRFDPTKLVS